MKFKMNNREWEILEVPQSKFWEDYGELDKMNDNETYFGRTKYKLQQIWLDEELPVDLKKKTLYHELMHCYKGCYICFYELNNQDEDFWCELSSNSHDIIHEIVEEYFKELEREDVESKYSCKSGAEILKSIQEQQKFGKDEGWKEMKL